MIQVHAPLFALLVLNSMSAALASSDSACEGTTTVPALVTVQTAGPEQFVVRVTNQSDLDQMIDLCLGVGPPLFVGVGLATGNGGRNRDPLNGRIWSWRAADGAVGLGNVCAEIYDGRPSFVEMNLHYWVETVGAFCPWSGQVVAVAADTSIPADFDIDGDVDGDDFALLNACFTGSANACYSSPPGCCAADMNADTRVDCVDYELWRSMWTEPGDPPVHPQCLGAVPAVSEWGLVAMTLLLSAGIMIKSCRVRRADHTLGSGDVDDGGTR